MSIVPVAAAFYGFCLLLWLTALYAYIVGNHGAATALVGIPTGAVIPTILFAACYRDERTP